MSNCYIIAEAGVNHNGDINIARQLIDEAAVCGVDAVKFQIFIASELVCGYAEKANYQSRNDSSTSTQQEMLEKLSLTFDQFTELKRYCNSRNIEFLATAFDLISLQFLLSMGISRLKIPSGEITNYPYLVMCGKSGLPIILSTGMCDIAEVASAVELLRASGAHDITLLHCTTEYPAPLGHINLSAMMTLGKEFGVSYGYSDHTEGINVPIMAATLGATVIEKHFTLDKKMQGPDHKASLEPNELKAMTDAIRNVKIILGDGEKSISDCEVSNKLIARKSIVARHNIAVGELLTADNICAKRPGYGLSPMQWNNVVGTNAKQDYKKDEMIKL